MIDRSLPPNGGGAEMPGIDENIGRMRLTAKSWSSVCERVSLEKTRLPTGTLPASKRITKGGTDPLGMKRCARWIWIALHLADGTEVLAYRVEDGRDGACWRAAAWRVQAGGRALAREAPAIDETAWVNQDGGAVDGTVQDGGAVDGTIIGRGGRGCRGRHGTTVSVSAGRRNSA